MFSDEDIEQSSLYCWFKTPTRLSCEVCGKVLDKASVGIYKTDAFQISDNYYVVPTKHTLCRELFILTPQLYI